MKYKDGYEFLDLPSPPDVERFVDNNFAISEQVSVLLDKRGWSQKDLAEAVGKSESEISRWLCGTHNLTLRSIAKMEAALGEDIITTPLKQAPEKEVVRYVYMHTKVYVPAARSGMSMQIVPTIEMDEQSEQAQDLKGVA